MRRVGIGLGLLGAALAALPASDAHACGGTFCDSGPTAMPVDQTGENILFVVDRSTVEAHVQIQYQGSAERFAWVVPLPAVPNVSVGSQALFQALLSATVPSFGFSTQQDSCPCPGCVDAGVSFGSGGASSGPPPPNGGDGGVNVLYRRVVGAFEVTALQGRSAQEVLDWLTTNSYQTAALAPTILQEYVAKGSVFMAVKLTAGADAMEIHPLVFKFTGTEACIPLELTAVAAVPDMGIRAFFLGNESVVPTNYSRVTLNPARIDWANNGNNYNAVVSSAVDEAGGRAWVTEYAGTSAAVQTFGLVNAVWDEGGFAGIDPRDLVNELTRQGLIYCPAASACTPYHPLLMPLLVDALPPPAGVSEAEFYACVSCYETQTNLAAFDSALFVQDLHERIFEPARHAAALLARWPVLTRLFTTISPAEMTLDPFFAAMAGYTSVTPVSFATQRIAQSGASGFTLPSGAEVALDDGVWPAFTNAMPWAELIEGNPIGSPAALVTDNRGTITTELAAWNTSKAWPAPPPVCPDPPVGEGGSASGFGSGGSGSGASGSGGLGSGGLGSGRVGSRPPTGSSSGGSTAGAAGQSFDADEGQVRASGGCSSAPRGDDDSFAAFALLGAIGALGRSRARRNDHGLAVERCDGP